VGNFEFTEIQKEVLEGIANLCPLTGADAVYKARGLVYSYNPTATFDDEANCSPVYGYRISKPETEGKVPATESIMLYPNPSSGILNVILATKLDGRFLVRIYSSVGQRVYSLDANSKELKIDLAELGISSGLYMLEAANVDGNYLAKSKFIYEKK